jgi:hypothetical protein
MKRNRRKHLLEQIKKEKLELEKLKQTDVVNIDKFFTGEITPVSELTSLFICSSKSTL